MSTILPVRFVNFEQNFLGRFCSKFCDKSQLLTIVSFNITYTASGICVSSHSDKSEEKRLLKSIFIEKKVTDLLFGWKHVALKHFSHIQVLVHMNVTLYRGLRGRDHIVVRFTTTCTISVYHH
jgi:sugar phosphate permease